MFLRPVVTEKFTNTDKQSCVLYECRSGMYNLCTGGSNLLFLLNRVSLRARVHGTKPFQNDDFFGPKIAHHCIRLISR